MFGRVRGSILSRRRSRQLLAYRLHLKYPRLAGYRRLAPNAIYFGTNRDDFSGRAQALR